MNFSTKKINRYKLPPIVFLLFIALPTFINDRHNGHIQAVITATITLWLMCTVLYYLFILTLGRLIKNDLLAICANSGLVFLLTGTAFKIMHWPGAQMQLIIGSLYIAYAVIGIFSIRNQKVE